MRRQSDGLGRTRGGLCDGGMHARLGRVGRSAPGGPFARGCRLHPWLWPGGRRHAAGPVAAERCRPRLACPVLVRAGDRSGADFPARGLHAYARSRSEAAGAGPPRRCGHTDRPTCRAARDLARIPARCHPVRGGRRRCRGHVPRVRIAARGAARVPGLDPVQRGHRRRRRPLRQARGCVAWICACLDGAGIRPTQLWLSQPATRRCAAPAWPDRSAPCTPLRPVAARSRIRSPRGCG